MNAFTSQVFFDSEKIICIHLFRMKLNIIFIVVIISTRGTADLQCSSSLGFSIPTMCRVTGGSIGNDESLQISNANPNITTLTFSNTAFTQIPLNTFVNYPKVKVFYVTGNNLNSFPPGSFQNALQLTVLFFDSNEITNLPDQTFQSCTSLQRLSINNNPLTIITGRPFQGLDKLIELSFEDLQIQQFDSSVFDDLTSLQTLSMLNCSLTTIDKNFLANNLKVTDIMLSFNQLTTIEDGALTNLKNLNFLDVSYNSLSSLSTSFAKSVSANGNKLNSLHIGSTATRVNINDNMVSKITCDSALSIRFFYATSNYLSKIPCVGKMTNAVMIQIDSNRLAKINRNIFVNLKNVTDFSINDNPKLKIGSKMLASMKSLRDLSVDFLVNGYKNLRALFPKLAFISLTTKNWNCTYLTRVGSVLNGQKIYLEFNNATDKGNFKCNLNTWDVSYFNST